MSTSQTPRRTAWDPAQKRTLFAGVGSWTLDAFDYFILVFALAALAEDFHITIVTATLAITFTLVLRPVGALIFGPLAEHFGRKPVLVINIVLFSLIELATALAPNFETFFVLRLVYGVTMGGVWGVASALTMETVPVHARGFVSGLFQAGYPGGYLLASIVFGLLSEPLGWRGMFAIGTVPILLAAYIFFRVEESPVWSANRNLNKDSSQHRFFPAVKQHWKILVFGVVLMAAFNFFSHGTQDMYPTFLTVQKNYDAGTVSIIAICYNIAAILGGVLAGSLSEKFGRKKIIVIFALLALPCIPLWAFASGSFLLGLGAFLIQFMVQGAWGVVPAYLNELMPEGTRAVLPGFVYQLGNVIAASNATIQAELAVHFGGNYGLAMAIVAGTVAVVIAVLITFGRETRGAEFVHAPQPQGATPRG